METTHLRTHATGKRHRLLAMLFVTVVITYLDRSNLSIAATAIAKDLQLDPAHMGLVFSAFGWSYALLQIPGGMLVDRTRPRLLLALVIGLWSLATILQGFAGTFAILLSLRVLLGALEAPAYPTLNRVVTTWFPDSERARAIATYTSGQYVGLAFLTPALVLTQQHFGWQGVFFLTGALGVAWGLVWYALYREPSEASDVNEAELEAIRAGGGLVELGDTRRARARYTAADWRAVLGNRKLWGVYIGQIAVTSTLWFFLTWFPTYLVKYRHMDFLKAGFMAAVPFLAAFVGILSSGLLSDGMIRRGVSATVARKVPIVTGLLLSTAIVGANYVETPSMVILFMAIAFFGSGFSSITWVLVSSMAKKELLGLTGGMFNLMGNLSSICVPIVIGLIVRNDDFKPALVFMSAVGLLGALSYLFLVGRIERIR
ncbi:ACS family D-galactonate transporter-like MFS transporter [Paraburkholderia fungorum]|uniref:ACS family D-galactonate transporter-like MFS transporter n=1 Tax=Paraburkholderia fungorum TaxID=134537 RepID=A0AAW3UNX2_9BURK|nr:ACS family D-galactonate transporter-like MFS transporter [Paraburkholderia fungorum]MBB5542465.1 ACS family D-galactonate transporter-like MFS transporter [Paraburkholderia fungorum]MBB6199356.1 ACS family D-galactonate transporter-like MFS transporter [Paraburkholderia fungorum]PRZ52085.1 ACS family D-galactonate transporter-like MFS transporter [Paraburkholderia fungorum]